MKRGRVIGWILALLIVGGPIAYFLAVIPPLKDTTVEPIVPAWAKVAPEQIAEAREHGVPVAFENDLGMRFVLIPAGTVTVEDENGNKRQRDMTISAPLYVQITEVTNAEYATFRPEHRSSYDDVPDVPRAPVGAVTPEDAAAFALWLSERDASHMYRLPTEDEWEIGCRAGNAHAAWWIGDKVVEYANLRDQSWARANRSWATPPHAGTDGFVGLAPVASLRPNPWGLYDMLGNASEICSDRREAESGSSWSRGGSFADAKVEPRSRMQYTPRPPNVGFRLVSPLPEE